MPTTEAKYRGFVTMNLGEQCRETSTNVSRHTMMARGLPVTALIAGSIIHLYGRIHRVSWHHTHLHVLVD